MVGVWKENSEKYGSRYGEMTTPVKVARARRGWSDRGDRGWDRGSAGSWRESRDWESGSKHLALHHLPSWRGPATEVKPVQPVVEAPPGLGPPRALRTPADPLVECLTHVMQDKDVCGKMDAEGFVSIQWLLKAKPTLSRECGGNVKSLVTAVTNQVGLLKLDQAHRRVRLLSSSEQLVAEAKRLMQQIPFGVVPLSSFFGLPSLAQMMQRPSESSLDAEGVLRSALSQPDSDLVVSGAFVSWLPRKEKLRKLLEDLVEQDPQLYSKIQESREVPLAWIVGRYADRLGFHGHFGIDLSASEALAEEVEEALEDSQVLRWEPQRWTLRAAPHPRGSKGRSPERAPEDVPGEDRQEDSQVERERRTGSRAACQLRQLLDFYFEPFTLQHNRYLLDLILKRASAPQDKGPWRVEALQNCHFTWEDLQGLGRVQSALTKLQSRPDGMAELGDLKHLGRCDDGRLHLRTKLEVRSFVHAQNVDKELAAAAVRYLTASRENQQQEAPKGVVNVMSYAISDMLMDQSPAGQQRLAKVKRQILVYRTDLICLQGLDANEKTGASLAKSLTEEGYGLACSTCNGKANSILWDKRRWSLINKEEGEALSVNLRPLEDPSVSIRAVCWKADVHGSGSRPFGAHEKVLVCTDLAAVGGTEAAGVVDELFGLPSAAEEVLGEEVAAHMPAPPGLSMDDCDLAPVRYNGVNKLRLPDAMFFQNMSPVTVLSGHTTEYLQNMPQEDVVQQFPCFRLPLVAAFDWQHAHWAGPQQEPLGHLRL